MIKFIFDRKYQNVEGASYYLTDFVSSPTLREIYDNKVMVLLGNRVFESTCKDIPQMYTPQEIEDIFRYQEMQYTIEDAKYKIEEHADWNDLTEEEEEILRKHAPEIAQDFLDNQDMNVGDTYIWDSILEAYIKQLKAGELK